ncbi:MAG: ATP-binding protein, partial [Oscillibacter sp.]
WMLRYLGYRSEAEFVADNHGLISQCMHPDDRERVDADSRRQLECNGEYVIEYRMRKRDGSYIWVHDVGKNILAEDGRPAIISVCIDITARKELEEALRENRQRYDLALDGAGLAVWEYDIVNHRVLGESQMRGVYSGVTEDVPEALIRDGLVREDSVEALRELYRRVHAGRTRASADIWMRLPWQEGWWCQRITYSQVLDEAGTPVRSYGVGLDVTVTKQSERLYQEELGYRESNGSALLAVCHVNLNRLWVEYYRTQNQEQPSRPFDEAFRRETAQLCSDPAEAAAVYECFSPDYLLSQYDLGKTILEREYQIRNAAGLYRWVSTRISVMMAPDSEEIQAFFYTKDITKEWILESTVDTIIAEEYDIVFHIDGPSKRYDIVSFKPGIDLPPNTDDDFDVAVEKFFRRFGVTEDIDAAIQAMRVDTVRAHLATAESYSCEFDLRQGDGSTRRKQTRFAYAHRGSEQIILTRCDIEDIVQAEKAKQAALKTALRAAQEANSAKTEFMSRMSHDMRTPMNGILGLARLGRTLDTLEEAQEYFARISESGDYLLLLINDTLEMNRIESGQLKLHPEVIQGKSLLEEIIAMNRFTAESKGVEFVLNIDGVRWGYVWTDRERTLQIFNNLLGNAIKFTPPGGRVEMICQQNLGADGCNHDRVIIRDNGIGISPEFMPKLFDPFEQDLQNSGRDIPGTGLGLAIVKRLVELMGGHIEARSELGKGTEFTVSLDFSMVSPPEETLPQAERPALKNLAGCRILLCEDHPLNAKIAEKMLESQGILVDHAPNGRVGVERFSVSHPGYYSAILMDIRMPEMDGMEATRAIRAMAREDAGTVPILAMTANAFAEDREETRAAGMNDHLSKPVSPEELLTALTRWIS